MITLRLDQMAALANAGVRSFERRAVTHLRSCLPQPQDDDVLLESVRAAISKAAGYGIRGELAVLRYLNAMWLLGPEFDTDPDLPWAADILRDPDFDGSTKMGILKDLIIQRLEGQTGHE